MSTTTTKNYTRVNLAWDIVIGQTVLLITVIVLHILKGYDGEQMTSLTAILTPFTGLYLGIALQEFSRKPAQISGLSYGRKIRLIIIFMFGFVETMILLCGLAPRYLAFREMLIILSVIQALFGVQMGNLLKKIFTDDDSATQK